MGPKKTTTTANSTQPQTKPKTSAAKTTTAKTTTAKTSTVKASTAKTCTASPAKPSPSKSVKPTTKKSSSGAQATGTKPGTSKTKASNKPEKVDKTSEEVKASKEEEAKSTGVEDEIVMCPFPELTNVLMLDTDDKIKNAPKWVLLADPSGLAVTFLRYRDTNYLNLLNTEDMNTERLRMALLGAIWYGKQLVLDMNDMDFMELIKTRLDDIQPNLFQDVMSKDILKDEKYRSLVRPDDDDQYQHVDVYTEMRVEKFMLIVATKRDELPPEWRSNYYTIKVLPP